jgi:hypothetical protein
MPTVFQLSTISTSDARNTAVSGLPADGSPLLASVPPRYFSEPQKVPFQERVAFAQLCEAQSRVLDAAKKHDRALVRRGHVVGLLLREVVDRRRKAPDFLVDAPIDPWRVAGDAQCAELLAERGFLCTGGRGGRREQRDDGGGGENWKNGGLEDWQITEPGDVALQRILRSSNLHSSTFCQSSNLPIPEVTVA